MYLADGCVGQQPGRVPVRAVDLDGVEEDAAPAVKRLALRLDRVDDRADGYIRLAQSSELRKTGWSYF